MSDQRNENLGPGTQNLEGTGGAARAGNLEPGAGNLESGIKCLEAGGTGAAALPPALSSEAKPSAADPFFSGRKHYPTLDGLRGVAILMVMVFHYCGPIPERYRELIGPVVGYGWTGVDLFFVLSGFLITGILYDSKGQEHYFKNFYARRVLRIFPLYYGVLAVVTLALIGADAAHIAGFRAIPEPHKMWWAMPWLWTYTVNIYVGLGRSVPYLSHFWSLSVEEQYYLVWPIAVYLLSGRSLVKLCLALWVGALLVRLGLFFTPHWAAFAYNLMPARMDALAAGALASLLVRRIERGRVYPVARFLFCASSVLVFGVLTATAVPALAATMNPARWCNGTASAFRIWAGIWNNGFSYTLASVFFSSLLLACLYPGALLGVPGRLFNLAALRTVGKYSYGLYVFHVPLWIASMTLIQREGLWSRFRTSLSFFLAVALANAILVSVLAYASYHLYEKRFLKLKKNFPERAAAATPITTDH